MPYVSVWIDDVDCDCKCDGGCERGRVADRMEDCVAEAITAMQVGEPEKALRILQGDEPVIRRSDLKQLYDKWKKEGLSGFLPYSGSVSQ